MSEEGNGHVSDQLFKGGVILIAAIIIFTLFALVIRYADAKAVFLVSESQNTALALEAAFHTQSYVWLMSESAGNGAVPKRINYKYAIENQVLSISHEGLKADMRVLIPQEKIVVSQKNEGNKVSIVSDGSQVRLLSESTTRIPGEKIGTKFCPQFTRQTLQVESNNINLKNAVSLGGIGKKIIFTQIEDQSHSLVIYTTHNDYPIACALSNAIVAKANIIITQSNIRIMPVIVILPQTELTFEGGKVFDSPNSVSVFRDALGAVS